MKRFIVTTEERVQSQYEVYARDEETAKAKVKRRDREARRLIDNGRGDLWVLDITEVAA